jgi:DNA polymerase-1
MEKLVVLVDLHNALYRYYNTQDARIIDGQRVETVSASLNFIRKISEGHFTDVPDKVIVVSDSDELTFRHYLSPEYKGNRSPMDDELKSQLDLCNQALMAMGIPHLSKDGVEADDTIGMLSSYYASLGYRVVIVTADKDFYQLINSEIQVYNPRKKQIIDTDGCIERLMVEPQKVADLLAIMGDKVDNITGVKGAGLKTAAKWLNEYGSIQGIILNMNDIGGVVGSNLKESVEHLMTNLSLTKIQNNALFLTDADHAQINDAHRDEMLVAELMNKYRFKAINSDSGQSLGMQNLPPLEAYSDYVEVDSREFSFF